MNEKLKQVIKKLYPNFRSESETPQEIYHTLNKVFDKNKVYFTNYFTPDDLIKMVLYTYSMKKYGSFDWADSIMENIFFIQVFSTEKEPAKYDCYDCGGGGETRCDNCDGTGKIDCDTCDREGTIICSGCDGSGKIEDENGESVECDECSGEGTVECDDCGGEGQLFCPNCGGDGYGACEYCVGHGMIESDNEVKYTRQDLCSWNKELNLKALAVVQTFEPLANEDIIDYDEKRNLIVLNSVSMEGNLNEDVVSNELYCLYVSETPKLKNYLRPLSQRLDIPESLINDYLY